MYFSDPKVNTYFNDVINNTNESESSLGSNPYTDPEMKSKLDTAKKFLESIGIKEVLPLRKEKHK